MAASRIAVAAAAVVLALVGGCAQTPAPTESSDLTASAYRSRVDDATGGQFQITVTNTGERPVDVHSVALDSPGFDAVAPSVREVQLQKGSRIDIPTLYGEAVCDSSVEPLEARLSVTRDGEPQQEIDVPLDQPYDIIDRIHSEECTAERVQSEVSMALTISAPPAVSTAPLDASLSVTRGEFDGPIRVDEFDGSLLYGLSAALPVMLDRGTDSVTIPLTITTASCEAHVIADSKKPFVFPIYLAFGHDKPVYARIPVPTELQKQLVAYQQLACRR
ncbi:hypothetical protein ACNHUS_13055 [Actinomycetes bacterium M1A6_2h]